jgi:hypothetical protein
MTAAVTGVEMTTITLGSNATSSLARVFICVDRTAGPPFFDPKVAAFCPSQCLQSLNERGTIPEPFGITCNFRPQYGN